MEKATKIINKKKILIEIIDKNDNDNNDKLGNYYY